MSYVTDILDEHQALATARLPWETHWRDVARFVLPQNEGFDSLLASYPLAAVESVVSTPVSADKSRELYDMTSLWGVERLTGGLLSLKTPETEYWHGMQPDDVFGSEPTTDEKHALERLRNYQFKVRANPASGFWPAHKSAIRSMCSFGDGWMYMEEMVGRGAGLPYSYEFMPLPECFPGLDPKGKPNRMHRPFMMTCEQVVRKFGADKVSKKVVDFANDPKNRHNRVQVLHAVRPRDSSDRYQKLGVMGADFASCYILPDDKHEIGESGFFEFPFMRYAWNNSGRLPFCTGPVAYAMGELKSLNIMAKEELISVSTVMRPAFATAGKNFTRLNLNPGANNPGLIAPDGKPMFMPMNAGARPDLAQAVLDYRRNSVREMLYLNMWQLLMPQGGEVDTATAAIIKAQEKGEMFGPVDISLNEGLSMMVDREVGILGRKGALNDNSPLAMPDSMAKKDVGPSFSSPLDRLRRMGEMIGMQRLIEFCTMLGGGDPQRTAEIMTRLDTDDMLEKAQEILGAPATSIRSREAAADMNAQNQQMNQAMQALAAMQAGGETAKSIGEGGAALAGGAEAMNAAPALQRSIQNMVPGAQAGARTAQALGAAA